MNAKTRWHEWRVPLCVTLPSSIECVIAAGIRKGADEAAEPMHRNKVAVMNPDNSIIVLGFCVVERDVESVGYLRVRIAESLLGIV